MASASSLKRETWWDQLPRSLVYVAPLAAVILLGAWLRFLDLGTESYWFDEIVMIDRVRQDPGTLLQLDRFGYVLLAHYWQKIFGTTEFATRSLSAVLGTGALVLTYVLGKRLFSHWIGVIATFLMAISEMQIFYSQDYRYYSLVVFASLLSFLLMLRAFERKRWVDWGLYALASVLLFYTHLFGVFVLAAQNLYVLFRAWKRRDSFLTWMVVQALIGLAIAPVILPNLFRASTGNFSGLPWIPDRPLWYLLRTVYWYLFPIPNDPTWASVAVKLGLSLAFFIAGSLVFAYRHGIRVWAKKLRETIADRQLWTADTQALLLLGCWLVIPVVLPFVLSKITSPMFVDRYTIGAAPALYLLLAFAIVRLRKVIPMVVSMGALLMMIVPGLQQYYQADIKEQWNETAAHVVAHEKPGDVVVFAPAEEGWLRASFDWYYRGALPECDVELGLGDPETLQAGMDACTVGKERLWLVLRGSPDRIKPLTELFLDGKQEDMRLVEEQQFTLISLYLFELSN